MVEVFLPFTPHSGGDYAIEGHLVITVPIVAQA